MNRRILFLIVFAGVAAWPVLALAQAGKTAADAAFGPAPDPYAGNACVQCHRDLPGRSSEIVEREWKQSVHFAHGVACDGCHGGDPTVKREQFDSTEAFKVASHRQRSPEFLVMHRPESEFVTTVRGRSVSYFCGKCHAEIKEKHLGSPHGDFGDPTCLYCHGQGSHLITKPTLDIIDTRPRSENGRCSQCHQAGTMEAVGRIRKTLTETQTHIETAGKQYKELESWGYRSLELEKLTHHADEVSSQLRRVFHSFNMREINGFAGEIQDTVDRTQATFDLVAQLRRTQQQQTLVGIAAILLLLTFAGTLVYYKHAFLEPHG